MDIDRDDRPLTSVLKDLGWSQLFFICALFPVLAYVGNLVFFAGGLFSLIGLDLHPRFEAGVLEVGARAFAILIPLFFGTAGLMIGGTLILLQFLWTTFC